MIATHSEFETNMRGEGTVDGNPTTMHSTRAERDATIGFLWAVTKN